MNESTSSPDTEPVSSNFHNLSPIPDTRTRAERLFDDLIDVSHQLDVEPDFTKDHNLSPLRNRRTRTKSDKFLTSTPKSSVPLEHSISRYDCDINPNITYSYRATWYKDTLKKFKHKRPYDPTLISDEPSVSGRRSILIKVDPKVITISSDSESRAPFSHPENIYPKTRKIRRKRRRTKLSISELTKEHQKDERSLSKIPRPTYPKDNYHNHQITKVKKGNKPISETHLLQQMLEQSSSNNAAKNMMDTFPYDRNQSCYLTVKKRLVKSVGVRRMVYPKVSTISTDSDSSNKYSERKKTNPKKKRYQERSKEKQNESLLKILRLSSLSNSDYQQFTTAKKRNKHYDYHATKQLKQLLDESTSKNRPRDPMQDSHLCDRSQSWASSIGNRLVRSVNVHTKVDPNVTTISTDSDSSSIFSNLKKIDTINKRTTRKRSREKSTFSELNNLKKRKRETQLAGKSLSKIPQPTYREEKKLNKPYVHPKTKLIQADRLNKSVGVCPPVSLSIYQSKNSPAERFVFGNNEYRKQYVKPRLIEDAIVPYVSPVRKQRIRFFESSPVRIRSKYPRSDSTSETDTNCGEKQIVTCMIHQDPTLS